MSKIEKVRTMISRVERQFSIKFGKVFLRLSSARVSAAVFPLGGSEFRIELPTSFGNRMFKEDLFHELGHIFRWRYGLDAIERRHFSSRRLHRKTKNRDSQKFERCKGFVSEYAATSQDEDFCETFSAFLVNGGKTSGIIKYDGERIDLKMDSVLSAKFRAISRILNGRPAGEQRRLTKRTKGRHSFESYRDTSNGTSGSLLSDAEKRRLQQIMLNSPLKGL